MLSLKIFPTSRFPRLLNLFAAIQLKWLSMNHLRARLTFSNQGQSGPIKPNQAIFMSPFQSKPPLHNHTISLGIRQRPQSGKAATKFPCPVHRAEAQTAQRKNFAKNARFFGITLQRRKDGKKLLCGFAALRLCVKREKREVKDRESCRKCAIFSYSGMDWLVVPNEGH
jgi:hypothetical protein